MQSVDNCVNISVESFKASSEQIEAIEIAVFAVLKAEGAENRFVSVVLTNDEIIHEYNRDYRSVDRPTDVLSFPADEGDTLFAPPDGFLGDIMISVPRASEQGKMLGHSTERELMFLAVHGVLHLLGYDHMNAEDEEIMLSRQREIISGITGELMNA